MPCSWFCSRYLCYLGYLLCVDVIYQQNELIGSYFTKCFKIVMDLIKREKLDK